jgi:hypothetical protein
MTTRIKLRRDTAANWLDANPILAAGEPGLETDTGKIKYGDGVTAYADLPHAGGDTLNDDGSISITAGSTEHWVAAQRRENNDSEGCSLRYDSEGNLYTLVRSYINNEGESFAVITKYSPAGAVVWQHSIAELDPLSVAVDTNDCAYISGENGNGVDLFKFDADGAVLWKKSYTRDSDWFGEAFIEELGSSAIILVGNTQPIGGGTGSIVALKINPSTGDVITQKTITNSSYNVYVSGIDVVDGGGTIFVTGRYYDSVDDKDKMFVEKLDSSLDRVWTKSLESPNNYDMDGGDCASDALGNVYAVGSYSVLVQPNNDSDNTTGTAVILTKLNSSGTVQWTRRIGPGPCGGSAVGLNVSSDGYVYLLSLNTKRKTSDGEAFDYLMLAEGQDIMILAKYDATGAVIWQRYVDARDIQENNSDWPGACVATFGDKIAVQFYGYSWNNTPISAGGSDDNERDFFVVQLPADGTELTVGKLDFTPSRVPGRFVTHVTTDSPTSISSVSAPTTANSTLTLDSAARVANSLINTETYEYTFGADGTLTIPNDGDVRLTQTQLGYMLAIGGSVNNDYWDINSRAVTADADGNMYLGGEEQNNYQAFLVKIDPQGEKVWNVKLNDNRDDDAMRLNSVAIDPTTGNVVVTCEVYDNYIYSVITRLDQDTGRIINNIEFADATADVYLNEVAVNSSGTYVVAGSKFGEFSAEQTVTKQTGSTTSTLILLRSGVDGIPTNNWQIGGTGFSVFENIQSVEYYAGLTTTVRQGSGAVFDIADNGDGTYGISGVQNGGTNYRQGHKILVLGTALGGATPANDCVVTVDSISDGGVIFNWSVTGTAAGTVYALYTALTGTNYQVGSGATFNYQKDPSTNTYNNYYNFGVVSGGSNYVGDDVLTISGDQLGGTSPANDMTFTAYTGQVGQNPLVAGNDPSGTAQTSTWKLVTTTAVDFAGTGTWQLTYPLDRENFLATPTWQRTFGTNDGNTTDRLYALARDSAGNIITVGEGYGDTGDGNYGLATVFKFNSLGALQWSRKLNERNYDCYAKSVATIGTDIYVTHNSTDNGETVITKLSADGTVVWQRITDSSDDSVVVNAGDGNILVAIEAYNEDIDDNALKIIKMTPSGETVFKRWVMGTTDNDTNFKNGRCLSVVGDHFYITGYFYANNYNSSVAAKLPVNGDGVGEYGSFRYTDVNEETGSWNWSGLNGSNFTVNEVDLGESYAGALAVAPYVNTGTTVTVTDLNEGDIYVDLFDVPYTTEVVRDVDGGRIVFADGTTQSTSAQDVPQRRFNGQRYTLGMKDRGHHILCRDNNDDIVIPYFARVPFPVGSKIMIVNNSGNSVNIGTEGGSITVLLSGSNGSTFSYFYMNNGNVATLLNIGRDSWVFYGDVADN